jgi:hypothetical protein
VATLNAFEFVHRPFMLPLITTYYVTPEGDARTCGELMATLRSLSKP